jgi:6 kDa early secretory antigenic target
MVRVRYDLAEMERCEIAIGRSIRRIEHQLAELRAGLAPLRAHWTGDAATAWDRHQRRWDAAASDLTASLTALHQAIAVARANYASAVAANVSMWRP